MAQAAQACAVLRKYWGYTEFRHPQQDVVLSALTGRDNLVVLATGGGKSLCYQIPPMVADKVTIVISPLIALMEDQVAALQARGMRACFLGSAQSSSQVKADAWAGAYTFVYMTPELAVNSLGALNSLHTRRGICLFAIDEAHCVSEWGHDFRKEYTQLGLLRKQVPGVPIMALTATATPQVQDEIVSVLGMGRDAGRWVMSFERPNLRFAVERREGGLDATLGRLLGEERARGGGQLDATLIYTLTTGQADEIAEWLNTRGGLKGKAARYHAKLSPSDRRAAHTGFMRDDIQVLVATVAYGMGIDKPNIRCIIHHGCPASLESYYQQAGRAGRDGEPSRCVLLHSSADMQTLDRIKDAGALSATGRAAYEAGVTRMQAFCASAGCRHAALVNFFAPGTLPTTGPCRGGCDNCERRARGEVTERDVAVEARLLLWTVEGLRGSYGLMKAIHVLRGSQNKDMADWMKQLTTKGRGTPQPLHGAGKKSSEDWWKGLAGLLIGEKLLAYRTLQGGAGSYSAITLTPQGRAWRDDPAAPPLPLTLPPVMMAEEVKQRKVEAAMAAAQTAAAARSEASCEFDALVRAIKARRKEVADSLDQAPDVLVNDVCVRELAARRPASLEQLRHISGMSDAAVAAYGGALLAVITSFCAASRHLKHDTDWQRVRRDGARLAERSGGSDQGALPVSDDLATALRNLLWPKPPGAAAGMSAEAFVGGASVGQIASNPAKRIQPTTVLGHLADCAAHGQLDAAWDRLVLESRVDRAMAQQVSAAIDSAMASGNCSGIGAIKAMLPEDIGYQHIKVCAAMMVRRALWFCSPQAAAAAAQQQQAAPGGAGGGPAAGTAAATAADDDDDLSWLTDDIADQLLQKADAIAAARQQTPGSGGAQQQQQRQQWQASPIAMQGGQSWQASPAAGMQPGQNQSWQASPAAGMQHQQQGWQRTSGGPQQQQQPNWQQQTPGAGGGGQQQQQSWNSWQQKWGEQGSTPRRTTPGGGQQQQQQQQAAATSAAATQVAAAPPARHGQASGWFTRKSGGSAALQFPDADAGAGRGSEAAADTAAPPAQQQRACIDLTAADTPPVAACGSGSAAAPAAAGAGSGAGGAARAAPAAGTKRPLPASILRFPQISGGGSVNAAKVPRTQ